jgi:hypothetical protein
MDWLLQRQKRIDEDLRGVEGLDWITALRNDGIKKFRTPDLGGIWLIPVSVLGGADQGVRKG